MTDEALVPVFRVSNTDAAIEWYRRLGFVVGYEHSSGPAFSRTMVSLQRGQLHLILSNREDDAHADAVVYLQVNDVQAIADEFGVEVMNTPAAAHLELRDPDGNRLRIATPKMTMERPWRKRAGRAG